MLQQTQVDRVLPKYHQFLTLYPTLAALAAAPGGSDPQLGPLGYNLRAVRLHEIARRAVQRHGGVSPDTLAGLLALKGIGPYTAGAVACFAFGLPVAALDRNVRASWGASSRRRCQAQARTTAWPGARGGALPPADAYDWIRP